MQERHEKKIQSFVATTWHHLKNLQAATDVAVREFEALTTGSNGVNTLHLIFTALANAGTAVNSATAELGELNGYTLAIVEEDLP